MGSALARNNLAELLTDQGRDAEARAHLEHACRVFQASRYRYGTGLTEGGLARLDLRAGNPAEAAARLDAASEIFTALGATALVVDTLVRRVEWHLMDDDPLAALAAIDTAERAGRDDGSDRDPPCHDRPAPGGGDGVARRSRARARARPGRGGAWRGSERSAYEELRSLDVVARIQSMLGRDARGGGRSARAARGRRSAWSEFRHCVGIGLLT